MHGECNNVSVKHDRFIFEVIDFSFNDEETNKVYNTEVKIFHNREGGLIDSVLVKSHVILLFMYSVFIWIYLKVLKVQGSE